MRTLETSQRKTLATWPLAAALVLATVGCASPHYVVRSHKNPLVDPLKLSAERSASDRTMQVLRQYDLAGELDSDQHKLLADLQSVLDREPSAEKLYAVAELSYRAGQKSEATDEQSALDYYGASVAYAYLYLFDERFAPLRNPYDPQFRGACDLYNSALERALRIIQKRGGLQPGQTHSVETAGHIFDVKVVTRGSAWRDDDFAEFKFVSDYQVKNLTNHYQGYGLGVPLIAIHRAHADNRPGEKFYPPGLSFPVTAFLRLLPDEGGTVLRSGSRHRAQLELHDPLDSRDIAVGQRRVPLESDLSTPLAYFLDRPHLDQLADYGLIRPDRAQALTGLYMLQPYEPNKVPIVLVHGLWSSPLTWTEMYNDLRSQPEISRHYQIWFYLYPTGQAFWTSATRMRRDLNEARQLLDPDRREPALDQMVLVGHSMGGLLARLQTLNSRDDFWRIESDQPFGIVKCSAEVRQKLEHLFFFEPTPSVRRVITIATPHRGSDLANNTTRSLAEKIIFLPQMVGREQVVRDNPGLFRDTTLIEVKTSLDSLDPHSPIMPVLLTAERAPWVTYHNIVGLIPNHGLLARLQPDSDGIVPYASAHLDDAASEIVVNAAHMNVHRHPRSVLEVRRILLEHLQQLSGPAEPDAESSADAAAAPAVSRTGSHESLR